MTSHTHEYTSAVASAHTPCECAHDHSHGVCALACAALIKAGEGQFITYFIALHLVVKGSFFNVLEASSFG